MYTKSVLPLWCTTRIGRRPLSLWREDGSNADTYSPPCSALHARPHPPPHTERESLTRLVLADGTPSVPRRPGSRLRAQQHPNDWQGSQDSVESSWCFTVGCAEVRFN